MADADWTFYISAVVTGASFGYVIQRGGFCLTRAPANLFLLRDATIARAYVLALLVIAVVGCSAAPTFEERLSYLDLLKSRGTITEDEYAIMRRRLVEMVDPSTLPGTTEPPAAQAEPEGPSEPLSTEWLVGAWRETYVGGDHAYINTVETIVEFSHAGNGLEWRMTRQFRYLGCGVSVAEASGSAVIVEDGELDMTGSYLNGRCMVSKGVPVEFRLRREGRTLEALSVGADPLRRGFVLRRIQP